MELQLEKINLSCRLCHKIQLLSSMWQGMVRPSSWLLKKHGNVSDTLMLWSIMLALEDHGWCPSALDYTWSKQFKRDASLTFLLQLNVAARTVPLKAFLTCDPALTSLVRYLIKRAELATEIVWMIFDKRIQQTKAM
ncbi:hypothetical protein POM88_000883 [Heracleum sosnowskyi]|uniref:Uncharacterized protein n=1 Tax=Heracleum sosnowskyi TaxID=360622 RepID=A0AAD8JDU9_9APIA|nr:hypothetical protein POM88_000883 [Heracleum sosnowskyi]